MQIFDTGGYLTFFVNIIKTRRFVSLTSGSEHLLKAVAYVTWHNNEEGNCLVVREMIFQKKDFYLTHVFL